MIIMWLQFFSLILRKYNNPTPLRVINVVDKTAIDDIYFINDGITRIHTIHGNANIVVTISNGDWALKYFSTHRINVLGETTLRHAHVFIIKCDGASFL